MKIQGQKNLFWFLRPDATLDLDDPGQRAMYVQQVMTHGGLADVKEMLGRIPMKDLAAIFEEIKRFVPRDVRTYWEEILGDTHTAS